MLLKEFDPYIAKDWEREDNLWYGVACWKSAVFSKEIWVLKIISKEYEFIKWLVEKNKVDTFDIANYIAFHNDYAFVATRELKDRNIDEDHLIMLLSIQEKPLQLLIQFLK